MSQTTKDHGLKAIAFLIGTWKTEGTILVGPGTETMVISGTDIYEWALHDAFILHRVDVMMGTERTEVLELIGYVEKQKNYSLRSFDTDGGFSEMKASINTQGEFSIIGDRMRSVLKPSTDDSEMKVKWERLDEKGEWTPWMNMSLTRVTQEEID